MRVDTRPENKVHKSCFFPRRKEQMTDALFKCNFTVASLLNNRACDRPCMWPHYIHTHTHPTVEFHNGRGCDALALSSGRVIKNKRCTTRRYGKRSRPHQCPLCRGPTVRQSCIIQTVPTTKKQGARLQNTVPTCLHSNFAKDFKKYGN